MSSNSQARVEEVFAEAARLFASKNVTYQDSWRTQGWRGNLSRILEKSGRLRAILWRGGNVLLNGGKEHPRETALDMINTLAFMIVSMDDGVEWGVEANTLPVPGPVQLPTEADYYAQLAAREYTAADMPPTATNVPVPGEDSHYNSFDSNDGPKPTPRPTRRERVKVTDKGSGPRPIKDAPQA